MPLGVCALKSFLVVNGREASVMDLNMKMFLKNDHKELWQEKNLNLWINKTDFYKKILPVLDMEEMLDLILSRDDDIVGFSINHASVNTSLILTREIKKHSQKKVIFGGAGCYEAYLEEYLKSGVDAIVKGEGELTLLELTEDFRLCKGVYMLQNDTAVFGGNRELIDINTLPFPDFDDIIEDYKKHNPYAWVTSSFLRGCTNRCAFCDESPYWQRIRQRSPRNIVDELLFLKSKYQTGGFTKGDSTLVDAAETMFQICDLIKENNLKIEWSSQARPEKWLTLELLQKMYHAGCNALSFGVESGSQRILDKMNKKLNVGVIEQVIKDAKNAGIAVTVNLMVDSPGERVTDFFKTIMLIIKTRGYVHTINVSTAGIPYRSDWYRNPSKYGIVNGRRWHSKHYRNNFITAGIKKIILNGIKKIIFCLIRKNKKK